MTDFVITAALPVPASAPPACPEKALETGDGSPFAAVLDIACAAGKEQPEEAELAQAAQALSALLAAPALPCLAAPQPAQDAVKKGELPLDALSERPALNEAGGLPVMPPVAQHELPKLAAPAQLPAPYAPAEALQPEVGFRFTPSAAAGALPDTGDAEPAAMRAAQPAQAAPFFAGQADSGAQVAVQSLQPPAARQLPVQPFTPDVFDEAAQSEDAAQPAPFATAQAEPEQAASQAGDQASRAETMQHAAQSDAAAAVQTGVHTPHEPARMAEASEREIIHQVSGGLVKLERSGASALRLELQPAELGRVELRLFSNAEGLRVSISAENPAAGALLERYLPELRQSLLDAGVRLTDLNVGQQGAQAHLAWEGRGQSHTPAQLHARAARQPEQPAAPAVSNRPFSGVDYRI
jgi:flagellar hook-length control protein FliK